MFPIRRVALRILSTPSFSLTARSRTITSLTASSLRVSKQPSQSLFQRRWASDEVKKGEEVPISQLQPTPQEEVENAIHEDSAARTIESSTEAPSDVFNTANASEATPDTASHESSINDAAPSYPKQHKQPASEVFRPKATIYVGNLFFDVTEDDLTKEVTRFGKVERVKLIRDARGLSKGYAYVTFSNTEEATNAITHLHQQLYEGRRLACNFAASDAAPTIRRRPAERTLNPPSKTLFIGNMSWEMTDKDLNNMFRGIKNLIDVRVAVDRRTGQPRGFAHADFTDVKSAMEGFKALEGVDTHGRKLRIDYSYGPSQAPKNQSGEPGDL